MRRLMILYYWLFRGRNEVSFSELLSFLFKPTVKARSEAYIKQITENETDWEVKFNPIPRNLIWPKECSIEGIYQVSTETFDNNDWHYYQKQHTVIEQGDVLVDVGAAEGLFSLSVVDKCDKIIMIEPNDFFVASLKKTFQEDEGQIVIHNVAVGDKEGEILFNESSLSGRVETGTGKKKSIRTLDTLLAGEHKITFLKADLEGFEEAMLRGAGQILKKHKPKLAVTSYHTENDPQGIISIIKQFVPEYKHAVKGIIETSGKPVMIHFWL